MELWVPEGDLTGKDRRNLYRDDENLYIMG
jgi:hypothetical protein